MTALGASGRPAVEVEVTPPPRNPVRGFSRWVAQATPRGASVLNIGGGCDGSGTFPAVRRRAGHLVVVDPSERVNDNTQADERHQLTLEQYAVGNADRFEVAFAIFVLEHVRDPHAFTEAVARVLAPGGIFMAITPNQRHYFGMTTWAATRLGIDEWMLRHLREAGKVDDYHVPTEYRINSIRATTRHLSRAGFSSIHFRMWDAPAMYQPYLPGPLTGLATVWNRAAYRSGRPNLMGHLTFKAVL
jgi:ubiquinone/menaquinone biosynthesis C-methylase UbiE